MKGPDLDKERSEKYHTISEFLELYNDKLPLSFPRASMALLEKFKNTHGSFFKSNGAWSLDLHRKRVMDWLQLIEVQKVR